MANLIEIMGSPQRRRLVPSLRGASSRASGSTGLGAAGRTGSRLPDRRALLTEPAIRVLPSARPLFPGPHGFGGLSSDPDDMAAEARDFQSRWDAAMTLPSGKSLLSEYSGGDKGHINDNMKTYGAGLVHAGKSLLDGIEAAETGTRGAIVHAVSGTVAAISAAFMAVPVYGWIVALAGELTAAMIELGNFLLSLAPHYEAINYVDAINMFNHIYGYASGSISTSGLETDDYATACADGWVVLPLGIARGDNAEHGWTGPCGPNGPVPLQDGTHWWEATRESVETGAQLAAWDGHAVDVGVVSPANLLPSGSTRHWQRLFVDGPARDADFAPKGAELYINAGSIVKEHVFLLAPTQFIVGTPVHDLYAHNIWCVAFTLPYLGVVDPALALGVISTLATPKEEWPSDPTVHWIANQIAKGRTSGQPETALLSFAMAWAAKALDRIKAAAGPPSAAAGWSTGTKVALGVGGTAVGGFGLYALGRWLKWWK